MNERKSDEISGKSVVVTGGASGIGKAVVELLAAHGAQVLVGDIALSEGEALVEQQRRQGRPVSFVSLDLVDTGSIDAFAAHVNERLARVDILVNAAGWDDISRPFAQTQPDAWDRIIDINLRGPMRLTHAVVNRMIESGSGGAIVNVASDAGRVGTSGHTVYSAAKGGLIAFTKSLAREVARHQITVNCVAPGPVDTPFLHRAMQPNLLESMMKTIPMRRVAMPEEIADAIAFLASASAKYITGQVLGVNGGLTMIG